MIDGKKLPDISAISAICNAQKGVNQAESSYFKLKWYKKKTLHFCFKDLELLKKFNLIACRGKNWLPPADDASPESEQIMIEYKKSG